MLAAVAAILFKPQEPNEPFGAMYIIRGWALVGIAQTPGIVVLADPEVC
jgi:hypothetical protein